MLKKKHRLPVLKKGIKAKTVSTDFFLIKISKNNLPDSRFGFSVSKAIDKRAVVRNKIKRSLGSITQDLLSSIEKGYDFLFIVKKGAKDESKRKLMEVFQKTLTEEKLLK